VPSAVTPEPDEARDKLRHDLIPYFSLPFYRAMLERSGYEDDIKAFDEAMQSGDIDAATARISDGFLGNLAAIGSAEEAAESLRRYRAAGASSPCVGAVAGTDFNATLEALAGAL
jgi:alkanesulfonate monooxygenase SsuD/methylene tetrahydromethanopterin reductase-like flavin-dependent oxidoreductase (luciferase family)